MPFRFWFPKYKSPRVLTSFPGPRTREFFNLITPLTKDADSIEFVVNYKKSKGNYFCDIDNNVILDLACQDGTLPFGYNDKAMIKLLKKGKLDTSLINNHSSYIYPNLNFEEMIQEKIIAKIAPEGCKQVLFCDGTSSNAVELAVKMAFLNQGKSKEIKKLFVLENSVHGNENISMVCANLMKNEKEQIFKKLGINIERINLPFPKLRYPVFDNESVNLGEENNCIQKIGNILADSNIQNSNSAFLISPIQVIFCSY